MKYKYIKWHNNYDLTLGQAYSGYVYKDGWIYIDGVLYRQECFEPEEEG